ncbi:FAD/NAD(P)-binding protein [Desemzia sp. RIT804]|uniref:FAD/NAD(P)-binding protein n=1 Tax=Desemzia sp. RIT 804 TaxID=2810209 RepID=UPI00194F5099|nr:FAD/NAD(P)-binding protein [Desemzia sp. RIT 804]MBM6613365.1 FAD/NAD(P)-binding protein [Desemzia sp. RIT 804]
MKKIAIVGMGAAGVSVLNAISKNKDYQNCEIVLYDQPRTFGTGVPYQSDSEKLLINQTADTMSLDPEDSLDFVKWVQKKKGIPNSEKSFFPRTWFGDYMQEKLAESVKMVQPRIIYEWVTDLKVKDDGTYLIKSDTASEHYDIVHLCIGHLPYQDPYQLLGTKGYIHHPYPVKQELANIPRGVRIGIIGTGLTGIDLIRYLKLQDKGYSIQIFSRDGRFPLYRGYEPEIILNHLTMENVQQAKARNNGFVPLEKMIEWFRLECVDKQVDIEYLRLHFSRGNKKQLKEQLCNDNGIGMLQAIIHKMDTHIAEFLQAFTKTDKESFFTYYEPLFKHFRTPMPKESLKELVQWWDSGEIEVWEGLQSVELEDSGFKAEVADDETVKVDYLVNATGHDMEVKQSVYHSELMNHLVQNEIIQPERFGGVKVIWPSAEAISRRFGILRGLFIHGQLIQGIQYGNNAHLLMQQAYKVVNDYTESKKTELKD